MNDGTIERDTTERKAAQAAQTAAKLERRVAALEARQLASEANILDMIEWRSAEKVAESLLLHSEVLLSHKARIAALEARVRDIDNALAAFAGVGRPQPTPEVEAVIAAARVVATKWGDVTKDATLGAALDDLAEAVEALS